MRGEPFCKDDLYRSAEYIITVPEWMIVKPKDKELCASLDWKHKVSYDTDFGQDQQTDNLVANIEALSLGDAVKIQTNTFIKRQLSYVDKDRGLLFHTYVCPRLP